MLYKHACTLHGIYYTLLGFLNILFIDQLTRNTNTVYCCLFISIPNALSSLHDMVHVLVDNKATSV